MGLNIKFKPLVISFCFWDRLFLDFVFIIYHASGANISLKQLVLELRLYGPIGNEAGTKVAEYEFGCFPRSSTWMCLNWVRLILYFIFKIHYAPKEPYLSNRNEV